ncbi:MULTISPECIES: hypothetical protein [unclassified Pseudomonas]|uniref:hypothetical protein n=1 Tax=unclassified Pseudomonas TaxID=196821 RepID=UPI0015873C4E
MGMIITEAMIMDADTTRATTMIKVEAVVTIVVTIIAGMIAITAEIMMIEMTDTGRLSELS